MIDLVFLICLSHAPQTCRTEHLLFTDMPLMSCMMGAQVHLADWAQGHPEWQIMRWRCDIPDHSRTEA